MVRIVTRAEWGARPPRARYLISTPTPRCWVHHTASEQHGAAGVRDIQRFHMDTKGWNDIAYSFLVDDDGTIYEGRGAGIAGGHTQGDNTTSHAICLMGNFENRAPTQEAITAVGELARFGRDRNWWVPTLGGHRDAPGASTACPGRHVYAQLPNIRSRVSAPQEDEEMALTEETKQWFRDLGYDRRDEVIKAVNAYVDRRIDEVVSLLAPFGVEYINRDGDKGTAGQAGFVKAPPEVRWLIELANGEREWTEELVAKVRELHDQLTAEPGS